LCRRVGEPPTSSGEKSEDIPLLATTEW